MLSIYEYKCNVSIGSVSYDDLKSFYDYQGTVIESLLGLIILGVLNRLCWLITLKLWETMKRKEILRKMGETRKRVRILITAGVNWRDRQFKRNQRTMEEEVLAEIDSFAYQNMNHVEPGGMKASNK